MLFLRWNPWEASEPKAGDRPTEYRNIHKGYSYNYNIIFNE